MKKTYIKPSIAKADLGSGVVPLAAAGAVGAFLAGAVAGAAAARAIKNSRLIKPEAILN